MKKRNSLQEIMNNGGEIVNSLHMFSTMLL